MNEHLQKMGVSSDLLSKEEQQFLRKNGYLNLGKLLSDESLHKIRLRINEILEEEGENAGSELMQSPSIRHPKESGATRLGDLVNKGAAFDIFYTQPKVLAAISLVLGDQFKLSSLNYRAALPGAGLQKLHVDWPESIQNMNYMVCNSIWLLDDFYKENGATRVVPGTHLQPKLPAESMNDPMDSHPDEKIIVAEAGSVVIFNSHTWHGGTTNHTSQPRRAIHSYFCKRDQVQQTNQSQFIKKNTLDRISVDAAYVLGLEET
ncbi:phytanoyl-CoA dioxygenase family protein [Cyclobacterium amurskyense]|uniref:Phytanoyl-CoA dioxygenase n=1 Tax=Cyclobacterium amurskyense TaxID=320787 RepID=A0A0H4PCW9_9BACT|nr:phytanoyl-CoA dioxygenase family protein [Cyclobacterium amurskyense]AKP52084.1 Phytanoyl-CoA dioxygenase [Cyclobacterium amurskyense]|tara:strand:- start:3260 stop:4045 length:786 start_codon:yes stop_codon:yes gene_type:complete